MNICWRRGSTLHARNARQEKTILRPNLNHRTVYAPRVYSSTTLKKNEGRAAQSNPKTYYELFPETLKDGPPPRGSFKIEVPVLRKEFLRLQAATHPDKQSDPRLKRQAEGTSSLLNTAFKTLSDPLMRARYVLSLRGIDLENDETARVDDAELLMEVMEAREVIENATQESDFDEVRQINKSREDESVQRLGSLLENGDFDSATQEAIKLRYWTNIREAIQGWEYGKPVILNH